jgi:predicted HicB family RNase H-like nuclease
MVQERVGVKSTKYIVKRSKSNKDFHRISVRLPVKLHKLAKKKAKQKGLSLSDLASLALEKYLKTTA